MWCPSCTKNCLTSSADTLICCAECGKVLHEDQYTEEATFQKNAAGQSQLAGNIVRSVQSEYSASRDTTIANAVYAMRNIAVALGMDTSEGMVNQAKAFYEIALERNFTRGRRSDQVQAACLYIACRDRQKPYLLIDFSEHLKINVYVLGAVFLQLCKLLSLHEHPIVQRPVDPSLFIHKFTRSLPGKEKENENENMQIATTALCIIASMKRDWMQTGRKPSGLCGAALYIAALSHGLNCSKSDIVNIVHICEATLTKRLIEFENTESGSLTIEELSSKAEEFEKERGLTKLNMQSNSSATSELLCKHEEKRLHFAYGLCEECYDDLIKISGGFDGGADPPAFQRAEKERMAIARAEENAGALQNQNSSKDLNFEKDFNSLSCRSKDVFQSMEPEMMRADSDYAAIDEADNSTKPHDESETLSDIDDTEVDGYLHNEEEKQYKKIIWEEMNKEYVEEQAAKEAAALAAKEAFEASFQGNLEELHAAQELAAAAAAAVAKSKKEKQLKRAAEARNFVPAQTAAEATRQMLTKKRLSSKINYEVLKSLFEDPGALEKPKKNRIESDSDNEMSTISKSEMKSAKTDNHRDIGGEDEYQYEDYGEGAYGEDLYYENGEEENNYGDDYNYDPY